MSIHARQRCAQTEPVSAFILVPPKRKAKLVSAQAEDSNHLRCWQDCVQASPWVLQAGGAWAGQAATPLVLTPVSAGPLVLLRLAVGTGLPLEADIAITVFPVEHVIS